MGWVARTHLGAIQVHKEFKATRQAEILRGTFISVLQKPPPGTLQPRRTGRRSTFSKKNELEQRVRSAGMREQVHSVPWRPSEKRQNVLRKSDHLCPVLAFGKIRTENQQLKWTMQSQFPWNAGDKAVPKRTKGKRVKPFGEFRPTGE